ncbi:MAG: phosphoglycerate dehydrogenase [Hyphomicrobiaceae bacterium]|nr:phosphoglycerate dehydrogenase [Hyphomicrobiaceae bacterium]
MKIAFAGSFAVRLAEPVKNRLATPADIITGDEASILPMLGDADVLVSMGFAKAMAVAGPRLKLIQVPGAGLDRIDRAARRPGLHLANAFGHEAGIAEYIFGSMISLTRSFRRVDQKLRTGQWESQWAVGTPAPPLWPELAGKTLGILGFGHIGEALAKRATAFDMTVCAVRRQAQRDVPVGVSFIGGPERLDEVLQASDYLAVTLSLSSETRALLDTARLSLMKPTAVLINVARAEIIEERALYDALSAGRLGGVALDVWYRYPTTAQPTAPSSLPFHQLDNVIMTPHVSGWTEGMLDNRASLIAENISRIAVGGSPLNSISAVD